VRVALALDPLLEAFMRSKVRLALLAAITLAGVGAVVPMAAAADPVYIAFGDSYAAGYGGDTNFSDQKAYNDNVPPGGCRRTNEGYPVLYAKQKKMKLKYAACSNASISEVWTQLDRVAELKQKPRAITIQAGGNDIGFAATMAACLVDPTSIVGVGCRTFVESSKRTTELLRPALTTLFQRARKLAGPDTEISVLTYPRLFQNDHEYQCGNSWMMGYRRGLLNEVADLLEESIVRAAQNANANIRIVNVGQAFEDHRLCTKDPWIREAGWLNGTSSYHPNAAGYRTYAARLITTPTVTPDRLDGRVYLSGDIKSWRWAYQQNGPASGCLKVTDSKAIGSMGKVNAPSVVRIEGFTNTSCAGQPAYSDLDLPLRGKNGDGTWSTSLVRRANGDLKYVKANEKV
jgi:lysophospholipase L1-like esterase